MMQNIDSYDGQGNLVHHSGPSTEWTKKYDGKNREVEYHRADGQSAYTRYNENGVAETTWDPPMPMTVDV